MALGATVLLTSKRGKRSLPVEDFFTGRGETPFALETDEMVSEIRLPFPEKRQGSGFQKLTYRSALDFALVSSAAWIEGIDGKITGVRIVVGGAGASPLLLREASDRFIGRPVHDRGFLEEAQNIVSKHAAPFMVDNLGSTLEYRRKMSGVMAKKALQEAIERLES